MKNILSVCLLSISVFTKAQDSTYCYNGGLLASKTNEVLASTSDQKRFCSLILMPYVMNEKEVIGLLRGKNNRVVEKLLTKVKFAKNLRLIGFAAIPAGVLGALSVADANKNHNFQKIGLSLITLGAVSLSSSVYFNHERKKNYKKAIATYNNLYN